MIAKVQRLPEVETADKERARREGLLALKFKMQKEKCEAIDKAGCFTFLHSEQIETKKGVERQHSEFRKIDRKGLVEG